MQRITVEIYVSDDTDVKPTAESLSEFLREVFETTDGAEGNILGYGTITEDMETGVVHTNYVALQENGGYAEFLDLLKGQLS